MGYSFTVKCNSCFDLAVIDAYVSKPTAYATAKEVEKSLSKSPVFICCFDTGANNTTINKKVVQTLGLKPINQATTIITPNAISRARQYRVDILLPNGMVIRNHLVNEVESPIDVFIGTDIINLGDLAYSKVGTDTYMSFTVPSRNQLIDLATQ